MSLFFVHSVCSSMQSSVTPSSLSERLGLVGLPSSASPLRDARVVFTAPSVYAPRLASALLERHARPIHMPTIETSSLDDVTQLEEAVLRLCDYDIVVFLSRSAIVSFHRALTSALPIATGDPSLLLQSSGVKVAALGADALTVRDLLHVETDYIPLSATPDALAQYLSGHPDMQALSSSMPRRSECRLLIPIPVVEDMPEPPTVPRFLQSLKDDTNVNFNVTTVPAYRTHPVAPQRIQLELDLIKDHHVDALVIASIAEAYALRAAVGRKNEVDEFVEAVKQRRLLLAAHGPVTADGVRTVFGIDEEGTLVVSKDWSSFNGVVRALEDALLERNKSDGKLII